MSILSWEDAAALRKDRKLVFTNGVFDILHAGHVSYLEAAAKLGDLLIVGLNSDESVRTLGKGLNRPINTLEDRALVIGALRMVGGVVSFSERTPEEVIAFLRPEVFVKGGDYRSDDLPEASVVRAYGGEVRVLPFLAGRSTTAVLRKLGLE